MTRDWFSITVTRAHGATITETMAIDSGNTPGEAMEAMARVIRSETGIDDHPDYVQMVRKRDGKRDRAVCTARFNPETSEWDFA